MIEHTITLFGPDCAGGRPHPGTVAPVFGLLEPVLRDNLRLAFFSSSRVKGRPHAALKKAWDIRFIGMQASGNDGAELRFAVPLLGEAAPLFYEQMHLWDDAPKPEETAFDLLGLTLRDIAKNQVDSNRFDLPLLRRLDRFQQVLKRGVDKILLGGHHLDNGHPSPPIAGPLLEQVDALASITPPPRRVRVQGQLDMVRCSDRVFELIVEDGSRVRAVWAPDDLSPIAQFLDRGVVIEGDAIFRPNGTVFRLDAEAIRESDKQDRFFSKLPVPMSSSVPMIAAPSRRNTGGSYAAIAGAWPGEESIDVLLEALAEMHR